MALSYTAAALKEHASLIEQNIEELKTHLSNRHAIPDYQTYCHVTGKIEGLRLALEFCDEAAKRLNES